MSYYVSILPLLSFSLILALSCYIILKAGEISFGQQAFFGIGAYSGGMATAVGGWSLPAAFAVSMAVAALVAWIVGQSFCRTVGFRFTLMTLIFGEFTKEVLEKVYWVRDVDGKEVGPQGPLGFPGIEYFYEHNVSPNSQALLAIAIALFCMLTVAVAERWPIGRRTVVVASDPILSASIGIDPRQVRLQAFVAAGAIAGLGGALFAHQSTYIEAANFSLMFGVHAVAYTLLGGLANVLGPALGTILDIGLLEILRGVGSYRMVAFGALIVIVLILFPRGLIGLFARRGQ